MRALALSARFTGEPLGVVLECDLAGHEEPGRPDSAWEARWVLVPEAATVANVVHRELRQRYAAWNGESFPQPDPIDYMATSVAMAHLARIDLYEHTRATVDQLYAAHCEEGLAGA